MAVTFFIGFFTVLLSLISSKTHNIKYVFFSFVILFIYLALRFDFGNDYLAYYEHYIDIKGTNWSNIEFLVSTDVDGGKMEFGYIFLVKSFSIFFGFFLFIAVHSLLMCCTYYFLIKKYVDIKFAWLGVLIFVFLPNIMSVELSAIRQALAIFCFMFSVRYLIERNFVKYFLVILLASSFHYSALILFPMYFIFSNKPVVKMETYIYIGLYIFIVFFGDNLSEIIREITLKIVPKYKVYIEEEEGVKLASGLGLMVYFVLYVFILLLGKKDTPSDLVFYRIAAMFIIFSQLGMISNSLSRLALYFVPSLIIVVPQLMIIKFNKILKLGFISILLFMILYSFYLHFTGETYYEKYFEYKTIFSELIF